MKNWVVVVAVVLRRIAILHNQNRIESNGEDAMIECSSNHDSSERTDAPQYKSERSGEKKNNVNRKLDCHLECGVVLSALRAPLLESHSRTPKQTMCDEEKEKLMVSQGAFGSDYDGVVVVVVKLDF